MARVTAWYWACGCSKASDKEVSEALAAAGIDLSPFEKSAGNCQYGIVCFSQLSSELYSLLSVAKINPCQILAVAISIPESALPVWQLLRSGASDTLIWDKHGIAAKQVLAKLLRWREIDNIVNDAVCQATFVGESLVWRALVRRVVEAARFSTSPILLTGESGTGKELLATLISILTPPFEESREPRQDLVTVDCGTLVPELS